VNLAPTNVIEGTKERIFVAFDFQLLTHARPVRSIQSILVKPFDIEAQAAEREQNTVELAHELLLFGRVVGWIPLLGNQQKDTPF
jgi:hypothetical protein